MTYHRQMKAVRYHRYGDPAVLAVDDVDDPRPDADELLMDVRAASVNSIDVQLQGGYREVPLPMTPGSDFAGVVADVGGAVDDYEIGDRVCGTGVHSARLQRGTYAESLAVPTDLVATLPDSVPFDVGAAVALVGVTVWRGLIDHARLAPSETCLVHGGSGGVGHVAVQFADMLGARVVTTVGSERAAECVADLGADVVFEYGRDDLIEAVRNVSNEGPDVVFDHRIDDYLQFDHDVAAFGGRIVEVGGMSGTLNDAAPARGKELTVSHMSMVNLVERDELPDIGDVLGRVLYCVANGGITAVIDRRFDLPTAAAAHGAVADEHVVGKVVIEP
jgi:NADPH2:quinone reductase